VEGHFLTSALGNLTVGNVDLSDDFDPAQSTLDAGFHGTIIRRTEYTYLGDKVSAEKVWTAANNTNATKYTTSYTYDTSGLRVTTTNPVGTISRLSYDVLNRRKTTKIGTVDGGPGDNMTSVEDIFYDDEEDASNNVGDGNVTRVNRYTDAGVARTTDSTYDYRQRLTQVDEPLSVRETRSYTNRNQLSLVQRYDTSSGSVLMAKTESFFDAWGQLYETREHGVSGGVASGYASVRTWRNGRGQVIKELSRGKVFNKTQYDGAGRVTNQAVSYDTAETTYAAAGNLTGDTVIQETRYTLDKLGDARLVGTYERRHDGTGTGGLTVGTSGNGRAQYVATWHDTLHRTTHTVNYGTNLGSDMTDRPAGNPPSSSSTSSLVAMKTYTIKSEVLRSTDPQGIITERQYDDPGRLLTRIENFVDGDPGPGPETDQDRTTEFTYDGENHVLKTTARASGADEVTENVFGVTKGASFPDSKIASNDLLKLVKYPDPTTGQPSTNAVDQESFAYNAQGERIWRKDQQSSQHTIDYDARGRRIHDRVNVLGTGIEGSIRRVSTTYDALDRPVKVSSFNDPTVGFGTVQNEVQYEYSRYNTISKLYQEWAGAVNTGTSRKVQYAYAFPTDGTTAVRRTSTTYTDGICLPGQKDDSLRSRVIEKVTKLLHEASRFCIDLSGAQEGLQGPCKVAHRLRVPRVNLEVMLECVRDRHECPLIVPAHSLDSSIDSAHFAKRLFVDVRDLVFHG
jgi:YD repeat-containing protein